MENIIKKVCTKCGEEKELSEFHKNKTCKYGHKSTCKECIKIDHKNYYIFGTSKKFDGIQLINKKSGKEKKKNYRNENRIRIEKKEKLYRDTHKEQNTIYQKKRDENCIHMNHKRIYLNTCNTELKPIIELCITNRKLNQAHKKLKNIGGSKDERERRFTGKYRTA
jgi:hypothetical protein